MSLGWGAEDGAVSSKGEGPEQNPPWHGLHREAAVRRLIALDAEGRLTTEDYRLVAVGLGVSLPTVWRWVRMAWAAGDLDERPRGHFVVTEQMRHCHPLMCVEADDRANCDGRRGVGGVCQGRLHGRGPSGSASARSSLMPDLCQWPLPERVR